MQTTLKDYKRITYLDSFLYYSVTTFCVAFAYLVAFENEWGLRDVEIGEKGTVIRVPVVLTDDLAGAELVPQPSAQLTSIYRFCKIV